MLEVFFSSFWAIIFVLSVDLQLFSDINLPAFSICPLPAAPSQRLLAFCPPTAVEAFTSFPMHLVRSSSAVSLPPHLWMFLQHHVLDGKHLKLKGFYWELLTHSETLRHRSLYTAGHSWHCHSCLLGSVPQPHGCRLGQDSGQHC